MLRALLRAVHCSPILPRPDSVSLVPGRRTQLPQHLLDAAAKATHQAEERRRKALISLGGAGLDYGRFGAAFRPSTTADDPGAEAVPACHPRPCCDPADPTGRQGRFRRPGNLGLACVTVLVTAAFAGVGMTVSATSAPAYEAGTLPNRASASQGSALPFAAAPGPAGQQIASDLTGVSDGSAATEPTPGGVQASLPGAPPTGAATTNASPGPADGTDIAPYPSFDAGSAPPGSTASTAGASASDSPDSPGGPAFGGLGGFSSGAAPATTRLASTAGVATPTVVGASSQDTTPVDEVTSADGSTNGSAATDTTSSGNPATTDFSATPVSTTTNTASASGNPGLVPGTTPGTATASTGPLNEGVTGADPGAGIAPAMTAPTEDNGRTPPITTARLLISDVPNLGSPNPFCCSLTPVTLNQQTVDVPEPASLVLLAMGAAAMFLGRRRRRR